LLRIFLSKHIIYKQRAQTINVYKSTQFAAYKTFLSRHTFFKSNFYITIPKRQQHFNIFDFKASKDINFSTGVYLLTIGQKSKFFKRNPKNILGMVLQMKSKLINLLDSIWLFSLRNFNYRQFTFFKKFCAAIRTEIAYFFHKRSFMPLFLNKRRIRRRVLRLLKKN